MLCCPFIIAVFWTLDIIRFQTLVPYTVLDCRHSSTVDTSILDTVVHPNTSRTLFFNNSAYKCSFILIILYTGCLVYYVCISAEPKTQKQKHTHTKLARDVSKKREKAQESVKSREAQKLL